MRNWYEDDLPGDGISGIETALVALDQPKHSELSLLLRKWPMIKLLGVRKISSDGSCEMRIQDVVRREYPFSISRLGHCRSEFIDGLILEQEAVLRREILHEYCRVPRWFLSGIFILALKKSCIKRPNSQISTEKTNQSD
jgi:hypothetical protein